MDFREKAYTIVRNSINSAIFIDEKAKDFYCLKPIDTQQTEEQLSINLHNGFKAEGISLAVHKFEKKHIDDTNLKKYFFKDRDLILLDWELDGESGEEYSLKLLSDVINYPHLNFCCIYTRSQRFDSIYSQIETYFSGINNLEFENIKNTFSFLEETDIQKLGSHLAKYDENSKEKIFDELGIKIDDHPLQEVGIFSEIELFFSIKNAFLNNIKSENKEFRSNTISASSDSFIINNTFIFLLKKNNTEDPNPISLIKRISDAVSKNKNSFIQLLGLEMQTIFNENERFVDENLLNSSTSALFSHRNYLKNQQKNDVTFSTIIKKLLIEHAILKLRTAKLTLLDTAFLDNESPNHSQSPSIDELLLINTFYNSVNVKSLNGENLPNLNFGDIFKDEENNYYLCITALCDCLYPNKIDHNFYFVVGKELNVELALSLGDTAFISFIPGNIAVNWGNIETIKPPKPKQKDGETHEQLKNRELQEQIDAYKSFIYKPYYVKPKIFNVQGVKMQNNKLKIWELTYKTLKDDKHKHDLNYNEVTYITTLRTDYTQRIANHAFGHPTRVGVDFIKK